jgi:hypothetical protein
MAERKETLWGQMLLAVGRGAGEVRLSDAAVAWLYDRYHPWLDQKSENGDTPQEVWEERGQKFLGRFTSIGRQIAASQPPGDAGPDAVAQAAVVIEDDSDCPYCPKTPIPG